ncbi:MAG: hypothetical protein INR65_20785 [Gluconacetobacter diazotrophicus]|nr:hypothetical protein [Gluconacetobacter diazotrophicus]
MKLRRLPLLLVLAALPCVSVHADISGFGTNGSGFTLNQGQGGTSLSVSGNVATLTNGSTSEGNSIFYNTPQSIGNFTASFTYTDSGSSGTSGGTADGFTFTLQNDARGAKAVGGTGNSLGYAAAGGTVVQTAVTPSAAIGFNIYNGSTTGLGTNGALTLTNTSAAVLYSGDAINVKLTYNGSTLTEVLTDASHTANTSTFTYAVNLIGTLGSTAYVGFTGADGATASTQTISNFSYVVPEPSTWLAGGLTLLTAGAAVVRHGRRA